MFKNNYHKEIEITVYLPHILGYRFDLYISITLLIFDIDRLVWVGL